MSQIFVNGEARRLLADMSVEDLINSLGFDRRGLAVAVGDEVVPRRTWGERLLAPGERVEILTVAQGG
jgi:sulfur carrier protein